MRHPKQNFCGPIFARWDCDPIPGWVRAGAKASAADTLQQLAELYAENDGLDSRINGAFLSGGFEAGYKLFLVIQFEHSVDDFP